MKKKYWVYVLIIAILIYILFLFNLDKSITVMNGENSVILGGEAVGIKLLATGVLVMEVENGNNDIKVGDIILKVNDSKIESNNELLNHLKLSSGSKLKLEIERNKKIINTEITPILDSTTNEYRLRIMG